MGIETLIPEKEYCADISADEWENGKQNTSSIASEAMQIFQSCSPEPQLWEGGEGRIIFPVTWKAPEANPLGSHDPSLRIDKGDESVLCGNSISTHSLPLSLCLSSV